MLSHNKTLAAQLYSEFKEFFPHNAVSYFVSYYDYYQPEAYIPQRDIYIEKDASINEEIDRLRLATTSSLVSRRDVIVVASVSCIYGLGSPADYKAMMVGAGGGRRARPRRRCWRKLVDIQYERNDTDPSRGKFRVRGDSVEVWPCYEEFAYRIEFWGDEIERLSIINPTSRRSRSTSWSRCTSTRPSTSCCRRSGFTTRSTTIRKELRERLELFKSQGKLLEAQRLSARTRYDVEMMMEMGYCPGIENYSRPLSGRKAGRAAVHAVRFLSRRIICCSSTSRTPRCRRSGRCTTATAAARRRSSSTASGCRARSTTGRCKFDEWRERINQVVYVSATPGPYELEQTGGEVVEQVVRPTGLFDPVIEVVPARGQVPHLLEQIRERAAAGERVLVTTLTKRLAEDLADVLHRRRRALQMAAQRAGCVRARGAAARSAAGQVRGAGGREPAARRARSAGSVAGGDPRRRQGRLPAERDVADADDRPGGPQREREGDSVCRQGDRRDAADDRRDGPPPRSCRRSTTREHGITPETIKKAIHAGIEAEAAAHAEANAKVGRTDETQYITEEYIAELEAEMFAAAEAMEFERAAAIRDRISQLRDQIGKPVAAVSERDAEGGKKRGGKKKTGDPAAWKGRVPRPKRNI